MKHPVLVSFVVVGHVGLLSALLMSFQGCTTINDSPSDGSNVSYPPGDEKLVEVPVEVDRPVRPTRPTGGGLTAVAPEPWEKRFTLYTVRKGDTLSGIAHRYKVSIRDIVQLNKMLDPDKLKIDQVIKLPGKINVDAPVVTPVSRQAKPASSIHIPAGGTVYVVEKGDSLSVIAKRFGIKTAELAAANGIKDRNKIKAGQKLTIPGGKSAPVSTPPVPEKIETLPPLTGLDKTPVVPTVPAVKDDTPLVVKEMAEDGTEIITTPAGKFRIVKADKEEDLLSVSYRTKVPVSTLRRVNNLTGNTLTPGQRIKVPVAE